MFSGVLNFIAILRVGAVALITILAGVIWWQNGRIENKDKEIANLEANISVCNSKVEANSFEAKWSKEFGDALAEQTWREADSRVDTKGSRNEKSNSNSNSSIFYDSF